MEREGCNNNNVMQSSKSIPPPPLLPALTSLTQPMSNSCPTPAPTNLYDVTCEFHRIPSKSEFGSHSRQSVSQSVGIGMSQQQQQQQEEDEDEDYHPSTISYHPLYTHTHIYT